MMNLEVPIVAVSSPAGRSWRGIVRASGAGLAERLAGLLEPWPAERELTTCDLRWDGTPLRCQALFCPGPRTFTGQDVLELYVPGNPALLERVLHGVLRALRQGGGSGRLAEPGEFARRAFLAGRIDLTRAEGIAATIGAVSEAQVQAARLLRQGRLGRWAGEAVERAAALLALVEAGIDFTDQEDVVAIGPQKLDESLAELERETGEMADRSRAWSALEPLPWVVLVGEPNVGKSTLFNALLGRARAVTSEAAGTTRDVLAEPLRIGDAEAMLVDVAGLDEPAAALDRSMQQAAEQAMHQAELLVIVSDQSRIPERFLPDTPRLLVHSKADQRPGDSGWLAVSARTGWGLEELKRRIEQALAGRCVALSGQMLALGPRHFDELAGARRELALARAPLAGRLDDHALPDMELIAQHLRQALDHLGALGGAMTPDDVIGRIFATFCIGK
jgi:tRNA modification GTPase